MRFEWDEAKSDANLNERGFDFEFATLVFDGSTLEVEDRRKDMVSGESSPLALPTVCT